MQIAEIVAPQAHAFKIVEHKLFVARIDFFSHLRLAWIPSWIIQILTDWAEQIIMQITFFYQIQFLRNSPAHNRRHSSFAFPISNNLFFIDSIKIQFSFLKNVNWQSLPRPNLGLLMDKMETYKIFYILVATTLQI